MLIPHLEHCILLQGPEAETALRAAETEGTEATDFETEMR